MGKTCSYPYKTRYKCYFYGIGHTKGEGEVKVTHFEISSKFTLVWETKGVKPGVKLGKKVPFTLNITVELLFRVESERN